LRIGKGVDQAAVRAVLAVARLGRERFGPRPQNLWVGDGPCGLLRAPQLIRKAFVFNGFQGVLNMLRTSYESSANWSSNSKVMPLQQE